MSTILEALRRAEQERNRGKVPTLHALSPVLAPPHSPSGHQPSARWWLWGGAALVCCAALTAALWWMLRPGPPRFTAAAAPLEATAPTPAVTASPGKSASVVPQKEPPPAAVRPLKPPAAPHKRAQASAAPAPAKAEHSQPAAQKPTIAVAPAPAKAPGPVFAPADLPVSVRAELPKLHLAGITWSANAKLRMAIVNGQVLHEGESAVAGLVLERVEPGRTIWAFRGYRIALTSE